MRCNDTTHPRCRYEIREIALRLYGYGAHPDTITKCLRDNAARCDPPLDEAEIRALAEGKWEVAEQAGRPAYTAAAALRERQP